MRKRIKKKQKMKKQLQTTGINLEMTMKNRLMKNKTKK